MTRRYCWNHTALVPVKPGYRLCWSCLKEQGAAYLAGRVGRDKAALAVRV